MMRLLGALLFLVAGGCASAPPRGFASPDPTVRAEAGVAAAAHKDHSAVPELVSLLESDDPAARMTAAHSLRNLTGQDFAYDHAADESRRMAAIARWKAWLRSEEGQKFVNSGIRP